MTTVTPATRIKNEHRKFLKDNKGIYKRAKAILDSPEELRIYEQSALELVRLYHIGDNGDTAIGLLAAAKQLLDVVDVARTNVQAFEDIQKRLADIESREEEGEEKEM